jgi:phytol kinase
VSPFAGIAVVLGALGALLVGVKIAQARGVFGAEAARKAVHIGMGVICLMFPLLFGKDVWPVWVLAGLAVVALGALRVVPVLKREIGGVLHDVKRTSLGEMYFPVGVAAVFTLARGDALAFGVPVALLTFADAAGALVGKRHGRHKYETLEGWKSIEGSLAVGVAAWVCVAVPLLLTGHGWHASAVIGAIIGVFGMMVEAISWRGLDNVFLPLAAFAQLVIYLGLPLESLVVRRVVLVVITVAAWVWRRGRVVDDSARLGGALALYFFWAVGGWTWLIAPVVLMTSYVRLMPAGPGGMPRHNLVAVICVGSAGLVWAVAQAFAPGAQPWLWWFTLGVAAHQAVIATVRFSQGRAAWSRVGWWAAGTAQAMVLQGAAFVLLDRGRTVSWVELGAGLACVAVATAGFVVCEPKLQMPDDLSARWWKQGVTAVVASAAGGAFLLFL